MAHPGAGRGGTEHYGVPVLMRYFRDLTDAELQQALAADIPGADTEYTLRRQLEAYPTIRRENTEPSWGPRLCVQPSQS